MDSYCWQRTADITGGLLPWVNGTLLPSGMKVEVWERDDLTRIWATPQKIWSWWSEKRGSLSVSGANDHSTDGPRFPSGASYQQEAHGLLELEGPRGPDPRSLRCRWGRGAREMLQLDNGSSSVRSCIWFPKLNCISTELGIPSLAAAYI